MQQYCLIIVLFTTIPIWVFGQLFKSCDLCGKPKIVQKPNNTARSPFLELLGISNNTVRCGDLEAALRLPFTPTSVCNVFQVAEIIKLSCGCGSPTKAPTGKPSVAPIPRTAIPTKVPVPVTPRPTGIPSHKPTSKPTSVPVPVTKIPTRRPRVPTFRPNIIPLLVPCIPSLINRNTTLPGPTPAQHAMSMKMEKKGMKKRRRKERHFV